MCASFAALAVAEATLAMAGRSCSDFSEKALHFCDSAKSAADRKVTEAGWYVEEAMRLLAKGSGSLGAASASSGCYPDDTPPRMYPVAAIGSIGGTCKALMQKSSCYTGFEFLDLTPKSEDDYPAVMEHIFKYGAAGIRFMIRQSMSTNLETQLTQKKGFSALPIITPSAGDAEVIYNHAVAIIGWDFSSGDKSMRFWIVKDSNPLWPPIWKLGIDTTDPKSAVTATGSGVGVFIGGLKPAA